MGSPVQALTLRGVVNNERKSIVNLTRGSVVCERALVADRPLPRMRGLMGHRFLPAGEGLLLKPAPSIHTGFMRFPIDVIFLDRGLRVVKLVERLDPWRAASAQGARAALELAAGEVARCGLDAGDVLDVANEADVLGGAGNERATMEGAVNGDGSNRRYGSIASTRLLLITTDRRFRVVVAGLLTRRGCSVTLGERMAGIAERAKREAAEVVILDAETAPVAAAREAARIESLEPPVGVVIVGEDPLDAPSTIPVVSRWGSIDNFYSAIQHARPDRTPRCS